MSERNACVFCIHELGKLPNGSSGPWCNHFNEPIKGYSRGAPDLYAGSSQYSHSGQARDHQNSCAGFSLDPQMRERWNLHNSSGSKYTSSSSFSLGSISDAALGTGGFIIKSVVAIAASVLMIICFGLMFGGDEDGLIGGFFASLVVGGILCLTWKSLGNARFFLVALPLLLVVFAIGNM